MNSNSNSENRDNETAAQQAPIPQIKSVTGQDVLKSSKFQSPNASIEKPKTPKIKDTNNPYDEKALEALQQQKLKEQNAKKNNTSGTINVQSFIDASAYKHAFSTIKDLQDIGIKYAGGIRAPEVGADFVPYVEVTDRDGIYPAFGTNYTQLTTTAITGLASTNFTAPYYGDATNTNNYVCWNNDADLYVRWTDEMSSTLFTACAQGSDEWVKMGVRQVRSAPSATIANYMNVFDTKIDVEHGTLETEAFWYWLYSDNTSTTATFHIIKLDDLIAHRNQSGVNPIPADALGLDLTQYPAANLGELNLLKRPVIVDLSNSVVVDPNNANYDPVNGCPAIEVTSIASTALNANIATALDRTFDKQTIQLALFLNLKFLPARGSSSANAFKFETFRAKFSDTVLRYFGKQYVEVGALGPGAFVPLWKLIWSIRVFKTCITQLALKRYGFAGNIFPSDTAGIPQTPTWLKYSVASTIMNPLDPQASFVFRPVFIPWEFYIQNSYDICNIELDGDNFVVGASNIRINKSCKWARSLISDTADNTNAINTNYYIPNATAGITLATMYNMFGRATPTTVMRFSSTTKTMSCVYSKDRIAICDKIAPEASAYVLHVVEDLGF